MTLFVVIAGFMLASALAFLLVPLLRSRTVAVDADAGRRLKALEDALAAGVVDRDEYERKRTTLLAATPVNVQSSRSRKSVVLTTAVVALLLPAAAIVIYGQIGAPAALDPLRMMATGVPASAPAGAEGDDMRAAIAGLVAKLEEKPDNPDGWALLGRAYQSTGQFAESRDALKRAFEQSPDNHDLTVEYAQALALAGEGRRIIGEPRALLDRVLAADPEHQRALWLVGISDYQQGNYTGAITAWNRLLPNLPAESDIATSVRTQIAEAQRLAGGGAVAPAAAPTASGAPASPPVASTQSVTAPAGEGPRLSIRVSLDASLQSKVEDGDTLFVFARAAAGPPMPLAIQRLPASGLPATVTLDDSMGMLPSMKLSMFPQVIIGARISKSGNAIAQSGDLQKLTEAIDVSRTQPIDVIIDSVVP